MKLDAALADRGRELVQNGQLLAIRDRIGVSSTTLAHAIGLAPTQLLAWIRQDAAPSQASAIKVATWYGEALAELGQLEVPSPDLVHVSKASQLLGASYSTVLDWCQRGLLRCHDLGVLGRFVYREDVEAHCK